MRVWVTRDEGDDGPLSAALRARGLTPVLEPVLERRLVCDPAEALGVLSRDDWLVLTSPYAIDAVASCEAARVPRVAVVGEPSARLARSRGLRVELISPDGHGAGLFAELRKLATRGVVCYPRSAQAAEPQRWADVQLRCPALYDTIARSYDRGVIERVDVVAVASPSAVRAVGRVDRPYASIGRSTSQVLRALGLEPWVEADPPSFEALAAAIADQANSSRHQRA
jgi:uroporphyrinogen-III synthase